MPLRTNCTTGRKRRLASVRTAYYPAMLVARSLTELLHEWDAGKLPQVASSLLVEKVVPVLLKCLVRTMQSQQFDGSWGSIGPCEETA